MKESLKAIVCAFVKSHWARLRRIALVLGVAFLVLWVGADVAIRVASSGRIYSKVAVDAVPSARAAVVLGCSRTVRGGLGNLYYQRRIRAAADLFAAGKVRAVVVSQPKFLGPLEKVPE